MTLPPHEYQDFRKATADFSADHGPALQRVRDLAKVPDNRFFSVRSDGEVVIDETRTRVVGPRKLSKSDQE